MGFFSCATAWRTFQGYEVMNMIRKGQVQGVDKGDMRGQVALVASLFGVVASTKQVGNSLLPRFSSISCNTTVLGTPAGEGMV
jgi:hypothetical protein